jgi:hypothetical protein
MKTREDWNKTPWSTDQSFYATEYIITNLKSVSSLYLYNLNTKEQINIRMVPESIAEKYSPKIVSVSPFGIIHPINFYVGGDSKSISFSFSLHEDYNAEDNMYTFVDRLKRLSEPVDINGYVEGPLVYLQLGSQFAGKGHITTSIEFEKPYRNGRYIYANCSMDFVFHEEFDNDVVSVSEDSDYTFEMSPYAYEGDLGPLENFEDFVRITYDDDYFIESIFGDKKVQKFLNVIEEVITVDDYNAYDSYDETDARQDFNNILSGDFRVPGEDNMVYYKNTYILDMFRIMDDVKKAINPIFPMIVIHNNLVLLRNRLTELRSEFFTNSYLTEEQKYEAVYYNGYTQEEADDYGWYYDYSYGANTYRHSTDSEKSTFFELYDYFVSILNALIGFYDSANYAGD